MLGQVELELIQILEGDSVHLEFLRDLEIYSQLAAPPDKSAGSRRAASKAEGAFVDRCALLLDPSMFENARRAALRFQGEVERATDKILTAILRRR